MRDKHEWALPPRRAEKRLVKMAGEATLRDCPNPERVDCPNSHAVHAVVVRRLAFPDFDNVIDHIATCAPCFEEYNRRRFRYRLRNAGAVVMTCAGLLILGLFWKHGPAQQPASKESVAQKAAAKEALAPVLAATLDYTTWTAERSGQSQPRTVETPRLTRALLDLSIKLPIGTEDQVYTVQFRSNRDESVAEAVGNANWNGTSEVLKIRIDLHSAPSGSYRVAILSTNSSARLYPVILE